MCNTHEKTDAPKATIRGTVVLSSVGVRKIDDVAGCLIDDLVRLARPRILPIERRLMRNMHESGFSTQYTQSRMYQITFTRTSEFIIEPMRRYISIDTHAFGNMPASY